EGAGAAPPAPRRRARWRPRSRPRRRGRRRPRRSWAWPGAGSRRPLRGRRSASEEAADALLPAGLEQIARRPLREQRLRLGVEEDALVGDREDARELVRHDDEGSLQAGAQLEDQVVEQARADRVEAGARLVEEEDLGIERHRAREAGALLHAAADLARVVLLEAAQADQRELERRDLADLGRLEIGVGLEHQPN